MYEDKIKALNERKDEVLKTLQTVQQQAQDLMQEHNKIQAQLELLEELEKDTKNAEL